MSSILTLTSNTTPTHCKDLKKKKTGERGILIFSTLVSVQAIMLIKGPVIVQKWYGEDFFEGLVELYGRPGSHTLITL